jgi:hypothetical protein
VDPDPVGTFLANQFRILEICTRSPGQDADPNLAFFKQDIWMIFAKFFFKNGLVPKLSEKLIPDLDPNPD